ncbi:MAG TPA: Arm DNA-binding domain-containing protein [Methylotenera sp.]|nr:Arm DNA-binding domain-containing protein [Methylotenera sp.]HPN02071.1 Arm DNA-binding domain-containing protein [Methylotenera sp.]
MSLNHTKIEAFKPKNKAYSEADGRGLSLYVLPSGSKWWRFRYRFNNKAKMISLGTYPDVSLSQARDRREEARKILANGQDPSEKRKEDKL